jgi:hypothetical protein
LQALKVPMTEAATGMTVKTVTNKKGQKFALVEFEYFPRNADGIHAEVVRVGGKEEDPPYPAVFRESAAVEAVVELDDIPF